MEYKFVLTPRLIALAIFSGLALMVLLFTLGFQIGKSMAPAQGAGGTSLADRAERRAAQKLDALAAPLTAPAKALPKAPQ